MTILNGEAIQGDMIILNYIVKPEGLQYQKANIIVQYRRMVI
jgi:hypothetical protein